MKSERLECAIAKFMLVSDKYTGDHYVFAGNVKMYHHGTRV